MLIKGSLPTDGVRFLSKATSKFSNLAADPANRSKVRLSSYSLLKMFFKAGTRLMIHHKPAHCKSDALIPLR